MNKKSTSYWDNDVIYMRWMKNDKPVRVLKFKDGIASVFSNTMNPNSFNYQVASGIIDDTIISNKPLVHKADLTDRVLINLLEGKEIREILHEYYPSPLGEGHQGDNRFIYYYTQRDQQIYTDMEKHKFGTFHICSDSTEE